MGSGCLHEWVECSFWVPAGFPNFKSEQSSPLRLGIMKVFYPLWMADAQWLHSRRDVYWSGHLTENEKWTYKTNSWTRDAKGDWIFTNFTPAAVTRK